MSKVVNEMVEFLKEFKSNDINDLFELYAKHKITLVSTANYEFLAGYNVSWNMLTVNKEFLKAEHKDGQLEYALLQGYYSFLKKTPLSIEFESDARETYSDMYASQVFKINGMKIPEMDYVVSKPKCSCNNK